MLSNLMCTGVCLLVVIVCTRRVSSSSVYQAVCTLEKERTNVWQRRGRQYISRTHIHIYPAGGQRLTVVCVFCSRFVFFSCVEYFCDSLSKVANAPTTIRSNATLHSFTHNLRTAFHQGHGLPPLDMVPFHRHLRTPKSMHQS